MPTRAVTVMAERTGCDEADTTVPEIWRLGGEDCSQRPRIKDISGQYFRRACYESALQRQRTRRRTAEIPPEPVGLDADVAAIERRPRAADLVSFVFVTVFVACGAVRAIIHLPSPRA